MSISRFLSLVVLGFYLIGLCFLPQLFVLPQSEDFDGISQTTTVKLLTYFALCLPLIWFPDKIGGVVIGRITSPSPGGAVAFMGWVLFALPVLVPLFVKIIYKVL